VIKGLIFDFDGLILETETPDYEAWREIYAEHGGDLPLEEWTKYIGLAGADTPFDPHTLLETQVGRQIDRDHLRQRRHRRYIELVEAQTVLPGVQAYIDTAQRLGLKLGVASSGTCDWIHDNLQRLGLHGHFDCIRCADDVQFTKPHPELYLAVLSALGLRPEEAIAFEDSAHGAMSATQAGIFCVVVPNPMTHRLPLDHADLRLNSLADLPLEQLITNVEEAQR
jgi:HAD superfamily hydrolase (TIGR01509 family)